MTRFACAVALVTVIYSISFSQQPDPAMKMDREEKPPTLMAGLGPVDHPVSTRNPGAQKFFNQGLALVYAFNHEEAIRSFKRAAQLDPQLAMAHWGIALALGPNINLDVDPEREKAAYEAVQEALALSAKAPGNERAYIEALATRYSIEDGADLKKLAVDYKNAMGKLVKTYPDDLDAATLYAEAAMNLRPWHFWLAGGEPAEGTEEIVSVLESVLKRNPNHVGANHYYIHTVEASNDPGRALPSAKRLTSLAPGAGHLVHMPAHIFMRTGNYAGASLANKKAVEVDKAYLSRSGNQGVYPVIYSLHNLHFLAVSSGMEGRMAAARKAARQLEENIAPYLTDSAMLEAMAPMFELYMPTPTLILVRFRQWDAVLSLAEPDTRLLATNGLWHFARGMAFASRKMIAEADRELNEVKKAEATVPAEYMVNLNSARSLIGLAKKMLGAKIALARGDDQAAVDLLRSAIGDEATLTYDEPPAWYLPVREFLGGLLLRRRDYSEAEKAFREELVRNPKSGRALLGLAESLKAQGKRREEQRARQEFLGAWRNADIKFTVQDLY